jgi:Arc/MetJ-type ribon-helix-helix transcriptional regulator
LAKRERLTSIQTKQVLLKLPDGMYREIMRLVEEKRMWQSIQDFIRDAIMAELRRQETEREE